MRAVNHAGQELVKHFEGLYLSPYLCPAGYWTIGWGHRCRKNTRPITLEEAELLLEADLIKAGWSVDQLIEFELTDNQFAALASFVFNLGAGRLEASTLRRKLNAGEVFGAAEEFRKWVFGGGKKLPGLVRRRAAEEALFVLGF